LPNGANEAPLRESPKRRDTGPNEVKIKAGALPPENRPGGKRKKRIGKEGKEKATEKLNAGRSERVKTEVFQRQKP